jgi:two-component system, NarL family, nitrate/nitrite response regulator NarL
MPAQKVIRVLIISAIRLYRDGLAQVLGRDSRVEVVGAFDAIEHSLRRPMSDAPQPDVVLLDTMVPDALKDMRLVSAEFPGAKVVALGVARDDGDVIACAEAGVAGYVFRDASIEELFATLESSARGELRCSPEMAAMLLRRVAKLAHYGGTADAANITRREDEILTLIDQGLSNKQIGARLFIEVATVKNHIHHILEKLGVRTCAEAASKARRIRSFT